MSSFTTNPDLVGHSFAATVDENRIRSRNYRRLIIVITLLCAIISTLIYVVALYTGAEISRAGHSANSDKRMIIMGDDVVSLPLNNIRYPSQRRAQISKRLDLYFVWPDMDGYSEKVAHIFNDVENRSEIIFATLEPRYSAYDMSGRLEPIYRNFINKPHASRTNFGLRQYKLEVAAGFLDEELLVQDESPYPYVARCMTLDSGATSSYCIRDIHVGKNLSLTYRFHAGLIAQWREIEEAIRSKLKFAINNTAAK